MNADRIAAMRTLPLIIFGAHEMPDAGSLDTFKVVDHAHPIPDSIALVQVG